MIILITGANGLVGRDLIRNLPENYKIFAVYRTKNAFSGSKYKNVKWIKYDLSKKINLKIKPHIIVNCVATHEFSKNFFFNNYFKSNVLSMMNIIEFAKEKKVKKIINLSTISIYGKVNVNLLDEKYIPIEPNLLGVTKYISENLLYYQPINFINLRLPGVLESSKNCTRPWLKIIINKIKNNKKIEIYSEKKSFNNVIDVKEIIRLILKVINSKKIIRDTFNLSASSSIKLGSLINKIKKYYNSRSKIHFQKNKKKSYLISVDKIRKKIGFNPASTEQIINRNL
tara:strand:+ start:99 stop:953 length:855 start_codon:yes stop_codon:yes gene_type:complete